MNYRSLNDLNDVIRQNLSHIPRVDAIVGIPRSGMLPASLIALYLGKPLLTVGELKQSGFLNFTNRVSLQSKQLKISTVLVVDDSCDSGSCINKVKEELKGETDIKIFYSAIYVTERGKKNVNFYFEQVDQPRVFEWNILDHNVLTRACVDLDGVLCVDPTDEQNDDGEYYRAFLATAAPNFIPHYEIHSIVTCRLEKYREQTEEWLKKHGVKYKNLYMMNYPTAEARREANSYSVYKAELYKLTNTELFIESSKYFAELIYTITDKPVYCLENNKFYGGT